MMELRTCAFFVTLVSLVTSTPYGYGVKGGTGAAARAESSASAGAYGGRGDIPVAVPSGNGFTGSYSKSSSSSSSLSSASSSSSSTSFSYSGAGGFSSPNGNSGCTTGNCQSSGTNDISANRAPNGAGAGLQGYNTVNSGAAAGSEAYSGNDCQGATCDNNKGKCSSGQCQPKSETTPTGYGSSNKCPLGQCETSQNVPNASPYDDSDDIRFVAHSSKSAHGSKDQPSNRDKTGYPDCTGGNCGGSTPSNSQLGYTPGSSNTYPSNKQQPSSFNSGSSPGYTPATHLETPKKDSKCSFGSCDSGLPNHGSSPSSYNVPIHGTYDSNQQKPNCDGGKCDNTQKGSYSSTPSNSLSTNYLKPQNSLSTKGPFNDYSSLASCTGPNCGPSNHIGGPPSLPGATGTYSGVPSGHGTSSNPTGCNYPNCNPHDIAGVGNGPNSQPNSYSEPNNNVKPSKDELPPYTGGFGGPAGLLKPNEFVTPNADSSRPSHTFPTSMAPHREPVLGSTLTGCNSPNCVGPGPLPSLSVQPNHSNYKPIGNVNHAVEDQPSYTGGFGGPAGMLTPNNYKIPTSVSSTPVHSASPSYNTPSTAKPGCTAQNCYGLSPVAGVTSSASAQSGSYGVHKQNEGVTAPSEKLPSYTGGFGGPSGMLKPNEYDINVTNKPVHFGTPSYNSQQPGSSPTSGCTTPNCNVYTPVASATAAANAQSGSYGPTKPSTTLASSSELPPYTGGFGAPTGLLKPNELNVPHGGPHGYTPSYSGSSPHKTPANNNLAGCTTPNCFPSSAGTTVGTNPQSSFGVTPIMPNKLGVTSPGYNSNYDRPVGVTNPSPSAVAPINLSPSSLHPTGTYSAGCTTPNCAPSPPGGFSYNNVPSGSYSATSPNSKPSTSHYLGGFGGSPSAFSPSNVPSTGSGSPDCRTPNCASIPTTSTSSNAQSESQADSKQQLPGYTGGFGAPSGLLKPSDYSAFTDTSSPSNQNKPLLETTVPVTCPSGNCKNNEPSSSGYNAGSNGVHASASSVASANAVAYSGGFGGPPGLLKPYDSGKIDVTKLVGGQNVDSHYGGANIHSPHDGKPADHTGAHSNLGAQAGSAAGANAYSGASANSGSYGYNQAGNGDKGGSPCSGGCGGSNQHGLNGSSAAAGAKSISSSGAFGSGGSFASSSASAHSSAGSYTKGGYGKR